MNTANSLLSKEIACPEHTAEDARAVRIAAIVSRLESTGHKVWCKKGSNVKRIYLRWSALEGVFGLKVELKFKKKTSTEGDNGEHVFDTNAGHIFGHNAIIVGGTLDGKRISARQCRNLTKWHTYFNVNTGKWHGPLAHLSKEFYTVGKK